MLQAMLIGNLGADCQLQVLDGRKFTTARVAHNERWTDAAGQVHDTTQWVDIVLNDHPKVAEFLKAGTQVFVIGFIQARVYSSHKDKCMKAGITICVRHIELLGGRSDEVPAKLYDQNGVVHDVLKYYHTDLAGGVLMSQRGQQFAVDDNGWVLPMAQAQAMMSNEQTTHNNETNVQSASPDGSATNQRANK